MDSKITPCNRKCPKCNSGNLFLEEYWEGHHITWEIVDGAIDRSDGNLNPGDPKRVYGECKDCGHIWRFRNATQIDHIL